MATYNPFEDFNPAFTRYEYLEIPEIEDPLYGKMKISSQFDGISPDGTWIAKQNIPSETKTEKEEVFGKDIYIELSAFVSFLVSIAINLLTPNPASKI